MSIPRFIAFDCKMSITFLSLSSSSASSVISLSVFSIEATEFLKSKRPAISLRAWLRAFSSSWASTLDTTSNELSLATILTSSGRLRSSYGPGRTRNGLTLIRALGDVAQTAHRAEILAVDGDVDAAGVTHPDGRRAPRKCAPGPAGVHAFHLDFAVHHDPQPRVVAQPHGKAAGPGLVSTRRMQLGGGGGRDRR